MSLTTEPLYRIIYPYNIELNFINPHYDKYGEVNSLLIEFKTAEDVRTITKGDINEKYDIFYLELKILFIYEDCYSIMHEYGNSCTFKETSDLEIRFYISTKYRKTIENPTEALPFLRDIKIYSILD